MERRRASIVSTVAVTFDAADDSRASGRGPSGDADDGEGEGECEYCGPGEARPPRGTRVSIARTNAESSSSSVLFDMNDVPWEK